MRQNLVRFRQELELSQPMAALEADVPLDALRRYESGRSNVDAQFLRRLAAAYGRQMEHFFLPEPPPAQPNLRPIYGLRLRPGAEYSEGLYQRLLKVVAEANEAERKKSASSPPKGQREGGKRKLDQ